MQQLAVIFTKLKKISTIKINKQIYTIKIFDRSEREAHLDHKKERENLILLQDIPKYRQNTQLLSVITNEVILFK